MIRAVIYARYSPGPSQRTESIQAQVYASTKYCQDKGYVIVRPPYADEALTGTSDDRPAFRAMIRDAKAGAFDLVVIHKIDRFARDRYDDAFYKRELSRAGVKRESVIEQFGSGPEGELVENIMADFADYFVDNLRRETKKGLAVNARSARSCGGKPCLGYDLDAQGHYLINELEAPIVKLIFVMYEAGHTYGDILTALEPYRSKRGNKFGPNSLHDILRNAKYCGRFIYNKRDYSGAKANSHTFRPAEEWVTVEDGVPAIVDKELWERVQAKMDGRKAPPERARQRAKVDYFLSGLIECGICGKTYIGKTSVRKTGQRWSCYQCGSRDRKQNCGNIRISKTWVEQQVLDALHEEIFSRRQEKIDEIVRELDSGRDDGVAEAARARSRLAKLENEMKNIVKAVRDGRSSRILMEELAALEKETDAARADMELIEIKESSRYTREQVTEYFDRLEHLIKEGAGDPAGLKAIIQRMVVKVIVHPDRGIITEYRVDDTTRTSGSPNGNRTRVSALRGQRPRPLDHGAIWLRD